MTPPPFPELAEAQIAVGSLSGIAPSDIKAHLLIVLTHRDAVGISGNVCDHLGLAIIARATSTLADRILDDHEHVAAGAAFLDEHDPDWWRADVERAINLDRLALANATHCILGQRCPLEVLAAAEQADKDGLASPFWAYAAALSAWSLDDGIEIDRWARHHGFAGSTAGWPWDDLTAEWKRVITERRSA